MSKKPVTLVVAAAQNNGIGINNDLPWRLRKDMAYFNRVTKTTPSPSNDKMNAEQRPSGKLLMNACIMGRRTWESIPPRFRPLDGRYNIVITRNLDILDNEQPIPPYTTVKESIASALKHIDEINANDDPVVPIIDRIFFVGGSRIYSEALELENDVRVLLTRVQFEDADKCDTFFPTISENKFMLMPHERLEDITTFEVPRGAQLEKGIQYEFLLYEKRK